MNKKLSCIVVDDEPLAVEQMKNFASQLDILDLKEYFYNAFDALNYLRNNKVDLVFLDIEMEGFNGIELLESIDEQPFIIFTTAYEKYALKGYELQVFDYLLKPISFQRLVKAVNRIYELKFNASSGNQNETSHSNSGHDFIFVKTKYKMQKICFDDILYIKGMNNYLVFYTTDGQVYTLQTFKQIQGLLPANQFVRIHKSYLISISKMEEIGKNHVLINKNSISIGENYKNDFFDFLKTNKII